MFFFHFALCPRFWRSCCISVVTVHRILSQSWGETPRSSRKWRVRRFHMHLKPWPLHICTHNSIFTSQCKDLQQEDHWEMLLYCHRQPGLLARMFGLWASPYFNFQLLDQNCKKETMLPIGAKSFPLLTRDQKFESQRCHSIPWSKIKKGRKMAHAHSSTSES